MSDRVTHRNTVALTAKEITALNDLRAYLMKHGVKEVLRRSISQSSLLKRYDDEEGDLIVERNGEKYVIPKHN